MIIVATVYIPIYRIVFKIFHESFLNSHFLIIELVVKKVKSTEDHHLNNHGTVNPLYNDIRYNSKIRYNVNLVCTKISGSCIFSLIFPCNSSGKHTFCVFVRIASARRF